MRGRHAALMIQMSQQTRVTLRGWLQRKKTPLGRTKRARAMVLLEQGHSYTHTAKWVGLTERNLRKWAKRFHSRGVAGLDEKSRPGRTPIFSPEVALYIVKLACERPDDRGRSLSQWDCPDLARKLKADGIVQTISPETVGRILRSHQLKPWRSHLWLFPNGMLKRIRSTGLPSLRPSSWPSVKLRLLAFQQPDCQPFSMPCCTKVLLVSVRVPRVARHVAPRTCERKS
jgi:transposase